MNIENIVEAVRESLGSMKKVEAENSAAKVKIYRVGNMIRVDITEKE